MTTQSDTPAEIDRLSGNAREAAAQVVRSGYIESGVPFDAADEQVFVSFIAGDVDFQHVVDHFNARIAEHMAHAPIEET